MSLFLFLLGLAVGSFINMAVYRLARENKITGKKRSFCDYCGRQLRWYENIPIVSWIIQRGKSRCCQKRLSITYPIVELVTGILFLMVGFEPIGWLLMGLLVFSAVFDAKYLILPDFSTYSLIVLAFLGVVFDELNIIPYLLSAVGASGFLLILNLITRGRGMGMGDVKLAIFMGLFLGFPKIMVAMYLAFIAGAVVGFIGIILGKFRRKTEIPFGPFLIFGTIVAWYYGSRIWVVSGLLPW